MSTKSSLAALLLVAACSGEKDEEPVQAPEAPVVARAPAPAPPPTAALPAPPPTTALHAPPLAKLTCDRIVSAAVRDKFFAGQTLTDVPLRFDFEAYCQIDDAGHFIEVDCTLGTEKAIQGEKEAMKQFGMKPLAGVGSGALISRSSGWTKVFAYDNDSTCEIWVGVADETDAIALVKQLLAELPPKQVAKGPQAARGRND